MLIRSEFPRSKTVMVINDLPVKTELDTGDKFSAVSNMTLLTSLRTGQINNFNKTQVDSSYKGIKASDIYTTYLYYNSFKEGSYDFRNEICKERNKQDGVEYIRLEHQKDVWIEKELWEEFQALLKEIEIVKPKMIIVTGKWSLFFLTGCTSLIANQGNYKDKKPLGGLSKFRSSILRPHEIFNISNTIIVPIYHTVNAMGMPDKQVIMRLDIEKLGWMYNIIVEKGVEYYIRPDKEYIIGTSTKVIGDYLSTLLLKLNNEPVKVSIDIETMYNNTIDCIGIAYETNKGICIPFASRDNPCLWSKQEEEELLVAIRTVMLHPNCLHIGQNYNYDCQYFFKLWGLSVEAELDTMILHHTLFNYLPKDLAFLASLYCETYSYWKDEIEATKESPETRWKYNAKDVMYTLEIANVLEDILHGESESLQAFYKFQQKSLSPALVEVMNRGVKVDLDKKQQLLDELSALLVHIEGTINTILGMDINLKSSQQVKKLFMDFFEVEAVIDRKRKTESFGSEAMLVYLDNYPLLKPLITLILEYRSIGIFVRTFLSAQVDDDNRMRTSYNVAGTRTYRLASRKNAFGKGMNLQNVPAKGKIDLKYSLMNLDMDTELENEEVDIDTPIYGTSKLPNCKELFICEEDERFFDIDLAAADARIIAWVSGSPFLTTLFEEPDGDPYLLLAREYYNDQSITKKDSRRQIFKAVVHGCLTGEHEVLTKAGWVKLEDLKDSVSIAIWDKQTRDIKFEVPKGINRDFVEANEPLYEIKGDAFHQISTQDHTFPYTTDRVDNLKATQAINIPKSARLPYNGKFIGGYVERPLEYMQLIAALQADGTIAHIALDDTPTYKFNFVKQRKIDRLRDILLKLNIPYKESQRVDSSARVNNKRTSFTFNGFLEPYMKKLDWWILDYTEECINTWLDELKYWDGHVRTSNGVRTSVSTTDAHSAIVIQTITHLCGKSSKVIKKERDSSRKTIYEVSINNRLFHNMSSGTRRLVEHTGTKVYCPKTSSGFFMVRYNGNIMVTGNTNYLGQAKTLSAKAGLLVHEIEKIQRFYFSLCPEIPNLHAEIEKQVRTRGYLENVWGARGWFLDRNDPMLMNKAVAWVGSSPVGILINQGLVSIREKDPAIKVLLQVHDSLAGVFKRTDTTAPDRIIEHCSIALPFETPRIIPVNIKTSKTSYGGCE